MAHEMAQALGSLSLAAEVSGVEPPPPQRVSSGAAWRAEMKMRTVVRVSAATEVGAPYSALRFSVHARPGDTEPFTVERSMNQLTKFIAAAGKAFGERAALPPLPRVPPPPADKLDEPYLTVAVALVQARLERSPQTSLTACTGHHSLPPPDPPHSSQVTPPTHCFAGVDRRVPRRHRHAARAHRLRARARERPRCAARAENHAGELCSSMMHNSVVVQHGRNITQVSNEVV